MEIRLREFSFQDIPLKIKWINDPENNTFLHYDLPLSYEKTCHWFEGKDNRFRKDFTILADDIPVGIIGLLAIDEANRKAEYYVTVGEAAYKHCGVATEATKQLLDYAFHSLHLHKVYLTVDADNTKACALYERSGFICEGVFKDDLIRRGKYINRKRYSVISKGEGSPIKKQ